MPEQPPSPQRPPPKQPKNQPPGGKWPSINWKALLWYVPLLLLALWFWQDMFSSLAVRTIPYSEFKEYLDRGEVVSCQVGEDTITGKIQPKAAAKQGEAANSASTAATPATAAGGKSPPSKEEAAGSGEEQPPQQKSETPATAPSTAERAGGKTSAAEAEPGGKQGDSSTTAKPASQPKKADSTAAAQAKQASAKTPAPFQFRTVRVEDPQLVDQLEAHHVTFDGVKPSFLSNFLIAWVLPIGLITLLWMFFARRFGAAREAVMNIGRSKARLVADTETGVRFSDVAGCDEAKYELEEVVSFLKDPKRFEALGAQIPKGALLVGPPGTGKTLLARAVAGEAGVPFFSLSGSEFVEMFVGVGASRVRDLFVQAKQNAPCIVFIDELDAVGRQRGVHLGAVNDEREQTLNQLLVEMDGFEANVGVIILAATNRPEVLDQALLRPGRFDRQIMVDLPDMAGREAILKVHARNKRLAPDADLGQLARRTPGFSGADLANVLNEAALLAARHAEKTVSQRDLEEAAEKVVAGPERRSRRLDENLRRRVAFHEVGHALVAAFSETADPVEKISIVPRGRSALGYTLQLPEEDQFLRTQTQLVDRLKGLLGGRVAEELVYGDVSTGAENDLERATTIARQMVCMYGMSETVGLIHCGRHESPFLQGLRAPGEDRDWSERTAQQIDEEVKKLLDAAHEQAREILSQHRDDLERIATVLLERETIDRSTFMKLLRRGEQALAQHGTGA